MIGEVILDWDECVEWWVWVLLSVEMFELLDVLIFAFALSGVAELLLDLVMGVVDMVFIGRLMGDGVVEVLGGLVVSMMCFMFCFKLFNFLVVVTGSFVVVKILVSGGWDLVEGWWVVKKMVGSVMVFVFVFGFVMMGIMEVFTDDLLAFCGASYEALFNSSEDLFFDVDVLMIKGMLEYGEDYL